MKKLLVLCVFMISSIVYANENHIFLYIFNDGDIKRVRIESIQTCNMILSNSIAANSSSADKPIVMFCGTGDFQKLDFNARTVEYYWKKETTIIK